MSTTNTSFRKITLEHLTPSDEDKPYVTESEEDTEEYTEEEDVTDKELRSNKKNTQTS